MKLVLCLKSVKVLAVVVLVMVFGLAVVPALPAGGGQCQLRRSPGDQSWESDRHQQFGRIIGTDGADVIKGNGGHDSICGLGGNDTINGNSGNDHIDGGDGADTLSGDAGDDVLFGGDDNENFCQGYGDDVMHGGSGNDKLEDLCGDNGFSGVTGEDWVAGSGSGYGGSAALGSRSVSSPLAAQVATSRHR